MFEPVYNEPTDWLSAQSYELMMRERRKRTVRALLEAMPELRKELFDKAFNEGRLIEARDMVRRVFAHRKLVASEDEVARIAACADIATLQRWLDQALDAPSAAEALL